MRMDCPQLACLWICGEGRLVGAFNWENVVRPLDVARLRFWHGAWTNDLL